MAELRPPFHPSCMAGEIHPCNICHNPPAVASVPDPLNPGLTIHFCEECNRECYYCGARPALVLFAVEVEPIDARYICFPCYQVHPRGPHAQGGH